MERLTKKIAGKVFLPLPPMNIKNQDDLETYHKVRKQYEENTIKLAEYEDFEEIFREKMTETACEFLSDKEEFRKWLERNQWIAKKCDEINRKLESFEAIGTVEEFKALKEKNETLKALYEDARKEGSHLIARERAKAIDEFANFLHEKAKENNGLRLSGETRSWTHPCIFDYLKEFKEIAEQMKGGGKNE